TGSTALATFRRGGTVSRGIGLVHFGGGVPSRMLAEIAEQPEALRRTFAALRPRIGELEALAAETRQVLFIARGSSDNAAVYGQYLCSARAGRLTTLAAPPLATPHRPPDPPGRPPPGPRLPRRPRPPRRPGRRHLPVRRHRGDRHHPHLGPHLRRPHRRHHQRPRSPAGRRRRQHTAHP